MEFDNIDKKKNIYKGIMLVIITAFMTFLITLFGVNKFYLLNKNNNKKIKYVTQTTENTQGLSEKLENKISVVKKCLEKYYLKEIPEEDKLLDYAVKGYVEGLGDGYTEYLPPDDYKELMVDVNGSFVGIGIYMSQDRYGNIIILMPIENSPAEEAELKTGDIIVKVNGEECNGVDTSIVANKIKGKEGTTVELEILRGEETLTKTVKRRTIQINYIKSEVLNDDIGYIKISAFDDGCSEKFEEKLKKLEKENIKSLIIDVRDNGGGIVKEVLNIAEMLLESNKTMMITVDKNDERKVITSENENNFDGKIVLLINENSASASEILASALQDNQVATLVGTTTYGKGVMQEILPLSDGSALKITIEEFITPNGNEIDKAGIKPDIEIDNNKDTEEDEQLKKAIQTLKQ